MAEARVLVLHKPEGYVTSRVDARGRPTVYDLLAGVDAALFPVGRLDRDSSGLLVLTDDGGLAHRLTDPAQHVPKTYHVHVRGLPDGQAVRALAEGVPLADGLTRPARVRPLGGQRGGGSWLEVVLTEGRNRQLRRMCAAVGHDVLRLVRVAVGPIALGGLLPGRWRILGPRDVAMLRSQAPPEEER